MAILNPHISSEISNAADGRFFYDEIAQASPQFYKFSQTFGLRHSDLLAEHHGVAFQAGVQEDGGLFSMDIADKPANHGVATLYFDARQQGAFRWSLVHARPNAGRELTEVTVDTSGQITAAAAKFDVQGRKGVVHGLDESEADLVLSYITILTNHELFRKQVTELRSKKDIAEKDLSTFSFQAIGKYSWERYDKEVENRDKRTASIGFVALTPVKL